MIFIFCSYPVLTSYIVSSINEALTTNKLKKIDTIIKFMALVKPKSWIILTVGDVKLEIGIESYADPGGGEPPPTPTSPVCDSAFSDHHGCWPCEHREHSGYVSHPSQPSSGRSSPRWDDDEEEERPHHVLSQGLGDNPPSAHPFENLRPNTKRKSIKPGKFNFGLVILCSFSFSITADNLHFVYVVIGARSRVNFSRV